MSGETIRIDGLSKLGKQLKALDRGLDKAVSEVNKEAAAIIAADGRERAPKRSGKLARSIRAGATKTAAVVRVGGASVPYAAPIHWGWPKHNIRPQPFLYDALDARRAEVVGLYGERVDALTREVFP